MVEHMKRFRPLHSRWHIQRYSSLVGVPFSPILNVSSFSAAPAGEVKDGTLLTYCPLLPAALPMGGAEFSMVNLARRLIYHGVRKCGVATYARATDRHL